MFRNTYFLKSQMLHRETIVDQLLEGVNSDAQMIFHKTFCYLQITLLSLYAFRYHWLITYQQQSTGGNLIEKAN